jgi:hypothetical protein
MMELISYSSSITPGDIQSVLRELKNVIRGAMLDGNIIDLGFIPLKVAYLSTKNRSSVKMNSFFIF